ncbi:DUF397 domain-containing protein [Actinomadura livida]|jgi:hypothetical protein|uniref:DUF397 domain-containing protein n=1 Tax=Actinomadura livida TaxID=79909 RepID=A0A7W7MZB4_9ACTN|nr:MULTISPECIES: DUF397 domain-containing protein [Actinomadura]MBB4775849.1 hypothetical protein [Actinomadura catellatispora]GGU35735.1 hypothetical protein GCM10010208_70410 [Actinomadura livida]
MDVTWRKSSRSSEAGDNCVELADLGEAVGIRDSKDPAGAKLTLRRDEFARLLAILKR